MGDVIGPVRRRKADTDDDDEEHAEGEGCLVAPQPAEGESPRAETRDPLTPCFLFERGRALEA